MSDVHLIINLISNLKSTVQELSIKYIHRFKTCIYNVKYTGTYITYVNT